MPLLVVMAVALSAAGGVTAWALTRKASPPTTAAPPATAPRSASPECVAIDRAYASWDASIVMPRNIAAVLRMGDAEFEMAADDATDFADAVSGYPDQAAKKLAVAAATVPVELGFARIQAMGGGVEDDQAGKVVDALGDVRSAYLAWRSATCL